MAYYSAHDTLEARRSSVKERCEGEQKGLADECRANLA